MQPGVHQSPGQRKHVLAGSGLPNLEQIAILQLKFHGEGGNTCIVRHAASNADYSRFEQSHLLQSSQVGCSELKPPEFPAPREESLINPNSRAEQSDDARICSLEHRLNRVGPGRINANRLGD